MTQPDNCRNCGAPYSGEERCEHCNSHLGAFVPFGIKNSVPLKPGDVIKIRRKAWGRNSSQIFFTPIKITPPEDLPLTEMLKLL